ncbi:MAG: flagellar biosynthetic protein FliO [Bdellovibrionaceae bacterium]|nr:flagellar biosynthetic protein FliO [Bdellovibrio sp.]
MASPASIVTTEAVVEEPAITVTAAAIAPIEAKLPEDQIPLTITAAKKPVEAGGNSTRLLFTGFVLLTLLGTAYYFVRKYKVSNKINKSNMQIKVLSQHYLGPKKSLAIIRVSGESILIGVTDTNISMIKSLSLIDDEVPQDAPQSFNDSLEQQNRANNATKINNTRGMVDELDEEFSFAGIKDSVSKKIKSMRNFS